MWLVPIVVAVIVAIAPTLTALAVYRKAGKIEALANGTVTDLRADLAAMVQRNEALAILVERLIGQGQARSVRRTDGTSPLSGR